MSKKKKKIKIKIEKKGLAGLTNFTTKSLSGAFINFKKKQELKKIKEIKLKKLQENNALIKEKKEELEKKIRKNKSTQNEYNK